MNTILVLVLVTGIVCAIFDVLLNLNLVWIIVLKKSQRKPEMRLFYYRFVLDVCFGLSLLSYISFLLFYSENSLFMVEHRSFLIFLGLPWYIVGSCRSIIALSIALERATAVYFPILYRTSAQNVPKFLIFQVALVYGSFDYIVLFVFCDCKTNLIPENCKNFGCAVNKCFSNYFRIQRSTVFSINVFVSILLFVNLFLRNRKYLKKHPINNKPTKANRLALLDTCTVFLFDFLPVFCGGMWPNIFSIEVLGPFTAVMKTIGCAIESTVVSSLLYFGKPKSAKMKSSVAVGQFKISR